MKKYFYSMLAAGMLLATSCSENELVDVTKGEGEKVTFKVELPGIESRAIDAEGNTFGSGKYADRLVYAMYEENKDDVLITGFADRSSTTNNFTVTVPMAKDIKYDLLFIAYDDQNCAFNIDNETARNNNLKALQLKPNLSANTEQYDAFVGHLESQGITTTGTTTVELKRPFAQVNVGTIRQDLDDIKTLKSEVVTSDFKIYNAPNTLNILTDEVSGTETRSYSVANIWTQYGVKVYPNYKVIEGVTAENVTTEDKSYYCLAMSYVLAGKNSSTTHDADFRFYRADGKQVSSIDVLSMPIQANYRTNILGTILTKNEQYEVKIEPIFNTPDKEKEPEQKIIVSTTEDLKAAIANAIKTAGEGRAIGHDIKYTMIELQPGTYTGAFDIVGKNVILMSNDKENTIIDGLVHGTDYSHIVLRNLTLTNANPVQTECVSTATVKYNSVDYYCLGSYVTDWVIENCTFNVFNQGNAKGKGAINIYANRSDYTTSTIDGVNYDMVITNTTFNCNGERPIRGKTNSYIEGCTFNDQHRYAIQVQGNEGLADPETVTFINNKIVNPCQTSGEVYAAAVSISKAHVLENAAFNIYGNTIEDSTVELKNLVYDVVDNVKITTCTLNGEEILDYNCQKVDDEVNEVVFKDLMYANKTYYVANAAGLVELSSKTIKGYEYVVLLADIDLEGVDFNGLSAFNPETPNTFDGNGFTVSNWTYNGGANDMGFIKRWAGPIKNIKFENCHLKTGGRSAIVAANVYSDITNVHVTNSSLEANWWACGAIAGLYCEGNVKNCSVTKVNIKSTGGTGGIVGVVNEGKGTRTFDTCKVKDCTITNPEEDVYTGAAIAGMINIDNSTVKFINCEATGNNNNTLYGYCGDTNEIIVENEDE